MLIDAPKYDFNKEDSEKTIENKNSFDLKEMTGDDFMNIIKKGM